MKPIVNLINLGKQKYIPAFKLQQYYFDLLKANNNTLLIRENSSENIKSNLHSYLLLVEHEPVYTVGIRSKGYDVAYQSKLHEILQQNKRKADIVSTNRGGLITFHGPGQLVAYPILDLTQFQKSIPDKKIRLYIRLLEQTIISTLRRVGIKDALTIDEYPGVWVDNGERKIAFIGVACKRFVTMHGISLNYNCDLAWFDYIESCGIKDKKMTSVKQELLRNNCDMKINNSFIEETFCQSFKEHFNCNFMESEELDNEATKLLSEVK